MWTQFYENMKNQAPLQYWVEGIYLIDTDLKIMKLENLNKISEYTLKVLIFGKKCDDKVHQII